MPRKAGYLAPGYVSAAMDRLKIRFDGFVLSVNRLWRYFELEQDVDAGHIAANAAPIWFGDTWVAERYADRARHGSDHLPAVLCPRADVCEGKVRREFFFLDH